MKEDKYLLSLPVAHLSRREPFSREINEEFGEGGGLNANYRTVEAIAIAANTLGRAGFVCGRADDPRADFIFKTADSDEISFQFRNQKRFERAQTALHILFMPRKII